MVILAAGLSERFGSSKALAEFKNQKLIEYLQSQMLSIPDLKLIIVLGAYAQDVTPFIFNHKNVQFVYNKDYKFGQTSSFQCGLKEISSETKGVFLLPMDCPFISSQTITSMMSYFITHAPLILIPTKDGRKGHPPLFHVQLMDDILSMSHEQGMNEVAYHHQQELVLFPTQDMGILDTFNTQDEYLELRKKYE